MRGRCRTLAWSATCFQHCGSITWCIRPISEREVIGLSRLLLKLLVAMLFLSAYTARARQFDAGAVVLVNSIAPDYVDFPDLLEPYLIHFGIPYSVRNVSERDAFRELDHFALVIIGHRALDTPRRFVTPAQEEALVTALKSGTGLVTFDGLLFAQHRTEARPIYSYLAGLFSARYARTVEASEIWIGSEAPHYIANQRPVPRTVKLKAAMHVPGLEPGDGAVTVARAGGMALILAAEHGSGRAVLFTTYDWVRPHIKGKLYGLDDLVWRSLVWAARKPFVIRGMPKFLALRVDDVSGFGIGANRHLGWIPTANRYGLKPWLGLFLDDLREDPEAVRRLAELTQKGLATASVHARRWTEFFYLDEPLATDDLNRNIAAKAWTDQKMAANWAEAEKFFAENQIVKSKLVLPHFYEFAPNNSEGLKRWGAKLVGTVLKPGYGYGTLVPKAGPYLTGEPQRSSRSTDPIFIADWLQVPGLPEVDMQFFNFVAEVRDITGYEWAPSRVPVEEAIRRGVEESRREFDSLLPAVLFTHESDHIQHIRPEDWERILAGVINQLKQDAPIPVTLDFVGEYMRALHTSRVQSARYDDADREGAIELIGVSEVPTQLYIFETDTQAPRELEVAAFHGLASVQWKQAN